MKTTGRSVKGRVSGSGGPGICISVSHLRDGQLGRPRAKPICRDAQLARPAASSSGMNGRQQGRRNAPAPGPPGVLPTPGPGPHPSGAAPAAASGSVPAASRGGEMQISQRFRSAELRLRNRLLASVRKRWPPPPRPLCAGVDSSHLGSLSRTRAARFSGRILPR